MAQPSDFNSRLNEERDVRVEDYLNDKLQTSADLDNLDSLLENVKNQQKLLREQLLEAERSLDIATKAEREHSTSLWKQAHEFNQQQADIDRRLLIVTQSETSDDAVRKFDSSMEELRRLDIANEYVGLLTEVDRLSNEVRKSSGASPQAALQPYIQLQKIAAALKQTQPAAEGAAPHLVDHVEKTTAILWRQMKDRFAGQFEKTLSKVKWPSKDITLFGKLKQEWSNGVEELLELQEPELRAREAQAGESIVVEEPLVLLPLEVMVKPLEMRFDYHFEGNRPTNKPDKPEYFLSHVTGLLNTYNEFFSIHLQPILRNRFKGSNLASNPLYIDSTSAFVTSLLPMLRRKVSSLLPQISRQPQLLSHLIHELMVFDNSLQDDWDYPGVNGTDSWRGIAWEVLEKNNWFQRWLQVEKDFALSRYQDIIDAPESGEIDYDSVDPGITKPTKAAIRVNDLLETVTDRYRPLTSFSQKLRFLIDIQIAIFDKFHERLHSSLEAYLSLTSSIARTVQGVSKEDQAQLQGLRGLERLCRIYGSAEYLEKKMRDWSDDVFFLDLWDELQYRARENSKSGRNLGSGMKVQEVAERTSSVVGSDEDTGALFDETASAYRRLRVRTEGIMQDILIHDIRESLRTYGRINPWSSLSTDPLSNSSLAPTAELDNTIQQLSSYLSFLSKVLAEAPLRRVSRQLALAMQTYLWDYVLMRNNFSRSGTAQFMRDMSAIWDVTDKHVAVGQGELGMKKLREAMVLLSLPVRAEQDTNEKEGAEEPLDVWAVEKRIFQSNESAREVLEELGLEVLSEGDARNVLEKRVELGS